MSIYRSVDSPKIKMFRFYLSLLFLEHIILKLAYFLC
jgi:hypothetical protein